MTAFRLELPEPLKGRIGVLDELKGLAILMIVVLYHAAGVLSMNDVVHGELGVDMFVILSGIGLALGSQAETAGRYLARRFLRIYPAYWIALTAAIVAGTHFLGQNYGAWDMFLHYTGMHVWFGYKHAMTISDSFWFITLIVSLYLVYLPLRRFIERSDIILFSGAVFAFTCAVSFLHFNQPIPYAHFSLRMPGFFVGLLIGRLLKTGKIEVRPTPFLGGALLLFAYLPYTLGIIFISPVVGLFTLGVYAFLVRCATPRFVRKALAFLGERSLEIFLIHQPLIREYNVYVIGRYFPKVGLTTTSMTIGMAVGFAVAIVLGSLLHAALRPLLRLVPATPTPASRPSAA